jgi:hypothetical protein
MNVWEIEQEIFEREEVRVVIRAPWKTHLGAYNYQRAASGTSSVTEWLQQRVIPAVQGHEVVVIDGNGAVPHGRTKMSTLRASYER